MNEFTCPFLNKIVDAGECYDVQMVRIKMIKPKIFDFPFNREEADNFCEDCVFNQIKTNKHLLADVNSSVFLLSSSSTSTFSGDSRPAMQSAAFIGCARTVETLGFGY